MYRRASRWSLLLVLSGVVLAAGAFPSFAVPGTPYRDGVAPAAAPCVFGTPLADLVGGVRDACSPSGEWGHLWALRLWYPYALAAVWVLAALAVYGTRGRVEHLRRRVVGAVLAIVTVGVVALEATYLASDYEPLSRGVWADVEHVAAFVAVLTVLLLRRPADRHLGAVEGTIGAQALLCVLHLLTLPSTYARRWFEGGEAVPAIVARLGDGFPLPFWLASAACLAAAGVVWLMPLEQSALAPYRLGHVDAEDEVPRIGIRV